MLPLPMQPFLKCLLSSVASPLPPALFRTCFPPLPASFLSFPLSLPFALCAPFSHLHPSLPPLQRFTAILLSSVRGRGKKRKEDDGSVGGKLSKKVGEAFWKVRKAAKRWSVSKAFERQGAERRLAEGEGAGGGNCLEGREDERRCLKLSCYSLFVLLACSSVVRQPWFWSTRQYWQGWPDQGGRAALDMLCAVELAYYLSGVFMLLWEVARKDQAMMMVHHCATVVLTGACYLCRYTRAGCVIMLIHDINDVIMEAAKLSSYAGKATLAKVLFVAFIICWVVLRMVAFPAVIIRSTMFEVVEVLGYRPPMYWVINGLFVLLYCIHVYWFLLILRIAWTLSTTGAAADVREEEDD